jgi:hypothetical protein
VPTSAPDVAQKAINTARLAQIMHLVRENQLLTAAALFILWQSGALLTAYSTAGGAICG